MTTPSVQPFPWRSLPRAHRVDPVALAAARALLLPPSPVAACIDAIATLASCTVSARLVSMGPAVATPVLASVVTLRLIAESRPLPWELVLEVDAPLVIGIVARVTRRPPPRVVHEAVTPAVAGAFAAVLATAIRRAAGPIVVLDATRSRLPVPTGEVLAASLVVDVDGESFHTGVIVPRSALAGLADTFPAAHVEALDFLPLELRVVACRVVVTASEIGALAPSDTLMLGDSWPAPLVPDAPRTVWLCAPSSTTGFAATLEQDGRVVLGQGVEELDWSPMIDPNDSPSLVEAVGEVPVVVRVEIGSARMKAREWAALSPGDVLAMGSKVGSKVTLRVSGMAVAEGELVDVEGEIGVRIRRRLGEK